MRYRQEIRSDIAKTPLESTLNSLAGRVKESDSRSDTTQAAAEAKDLCCVAKGETARLERAFAPWVRT
jgi:hypothetical protein